MKIPFSGISQPAIAAVTMSTAELVGDQFDMQLLLKLTMSVAVVLLGTLALKLYNSRNVRKVCLPVKNDKEPKTSTGKNCKTTLRQGLPREGTGDDEDDQSTVSNLDTTGDLAFHNTEETSGKEKTNDSAPMSHHDRTFRKEEAIHSRQNRGHPATSNISSGSTLNFPHPTESGLPSTSGRRSPCFLQKLEGSVGVGRELRQDLESPGAYSSFLSKAEIKVEDANVVLEGTGDQIVRGKIYDYYVESSSHSVTDSNAAVSQYERNSESQPKEFGSRNSNLPESPSSLSPIIMRDLIFQQSTPKESSSQRALNLRHPAKPALLRKESYLSAAEEFELPIPFLSSGGLNPMTHSMVSSGNDCVHPTSSASPEGKGLNVRHGVDRETVAFSHMPASVVSSTDFEVLKSMLDLGNCFETLCQAKSQGHTTVQEAALSVMSDNYLQVLRDPSLYGRLTADEREQIRKQRMSGRRFVMVADMDPQDRVSHREQQTAAAEQKRVSSAVYYYDDYKDAWHTLCLIPLEVISKACAMCTMDNYLFVAVGCQGSDREMTPSKQVFCYNPLTSIWKEISPMNDARPRCKLAALEGYIYAIGGECLSSVERYDPRLDRWTFVAPLPNDTFAVAHHVSVCNGELFVSGGSLRYILLRYNPKTDTWRSSLLAGSKDRTANLVAVGKFLYRFDVNPLLGVTVYRYHTVAKLWYDCSHRRLARCPAFHCITMDGIIYCISRHFTMRFVADEISPAFTDEDLSVLSAAKGIISPFVLSLPDNKHRQTSV